MRYITIVFLVLFSFQLSAQLPDDFADELVIDDFFQPVGMTFDDNGQMYVWEKVGRVYIVDTNGVKIPQQAIDIREEVGIWGDYGLLGFTLDPSFLTNGYVYLLYTVDPYYLDFYGTPTYSADSSYENQATIGRITRYQLDAATNFTTAVPNSRKILLGETNDSGFPLLHVSHGIGTLLFGTDGTLLASCGDGASFEGFDVGGNSTTSFNAQALTRGILTADEDIGSYRAQYLGSLNGKIIRINPETGEGIASNPFYDSSNPNANKSKIWALGFRNPYRMTIRPNTGSHYDGDANPGVIVVGDVGSSYWEEINVVTAGGQNFGWPLYEGMNGQWGFQTRPIPDNALAPNPLFGNGCDKAYFNFQDLLKRANQNPNFFIPNPCDPNQPIPNSAFPMMETPPVIAWNNYLWNGPDTKTHTRFFDDDGDLVIANIDDPNSKVQGDTFSGTCSIGGVFYTGDAFPEEYQGAYFNGDFSFWIKAFRFDDNHELVSAQPFHSQSDRVLHIEMNEKDGCIYYINHFGKIRKICYGGTPAPVAIAKADTTYGGSELTVTFDASASYAPFGYPLNYEWDLGDGTISNDTIVTHTFSTTSGNPTSYSVFLTVTDSIGTESVAEVLISLNNTPPVVDITSFEDGDLYPTLTSTVLALNADVYDNEHSNEELTYEWQAFLHHNTHFHEELPVNEAVGYAIIAPVGCQDELYYHRVRLTVTDPEGLSTTVDQYLYPYCEESFVTDFQLSTTPNNTGIDLTWTTQEETDVESYIIQRGNHIHSLETIGAVAADGTMSYSFTDNNPINGNNVYRIKAMRTDRAYDYSNFSNERFPIPDYVEVFPNPAAQFFYLKFRESVVDIDFELFDAVGKLVYQQSWADAIKDEQKTVLLGELLEGVYTYKVIIGEQTYHGKIMILKQ